MHALPRPGLKLLVVVVVPLLQDDPLLGGHRKTMASLVEILLGGLSASFLHCRSFQGRLLRQLPGWLRLQVGKRQKGGQLHKSRFVNSKIISSRVQINIHADVSSSYVNAFEVSNFLKELVAYELWRRSICDKDKKKISWNIDTNDKFSLQGSQRYQPTLTTKSRSSD